MNDIIPTPRCRHCRRRPRAKGMRDLCWTCYRTPSIVSIYPSTKSLERVDDEPTDEELDRLIEAQRATMPKR